MMRRAIWSLVVLIGLLGGLALGLIRTDVPLDQLIDRYSDEQSTFLEVGDLIVHLKEEGPNEGQAILLLHGTFSSLHTWDGWAMELAKDHRVIRMDLPGFGLTGPHPTNDYSLQSHLLMFETIRETLGIERWVVAGNSLGAGYALAYAQHFPDRIEAVGLLNGGRVRLSTKDFERQREETMEAQARERGESWVVRSLQQPLLRSALSLITPKFLIRYALEDVYGQPELINDRLVQRYQDLLRREGNREAFIARRAGGGARSDQASELTEPMRPDQLPMPILIQWGGQDRWIPPSVGARLATVLPTSTHILYEDLGHVPMEEAPARTVRDFMEFLASGILPSKRASSTDERQN